MFLSSHGWKHKLTGRERWPGGEGELQPPSFRDFGHFSGKTLMIRAKILGRKRSNKILGLQKRALRLMFFGDYKAHAVPFFISSSLLPLDLLYFKSVAVLMYDVSNNPSPPQISKLFNYQHNIHSHNTRSSTRGNFFLEYSRLDKQNMSFSSNGVRVCNNLSNEIRQMPKVKFKRNIHNMLLQKLSQANEYIDLLDLNMS